MPVLNTATNVMKGSTQAKKVFRGTTQIWPPAPQIGFQASWTNADMNTLTWGASPFNPRSITGLTAWFDASDTLPITSQWYDKSLTGHHGTIYGSPMPTILQNMVGQLNVMRFTANEGRVRMTGTGITTDWTLLYVARQISGAGRIVSGGANNILVGWWNGFMDGAYDTTPGWLTPDVKVAFNTAFTMYSADGSPTTAMRLFKNGTLISSGSVTGMTGWGNTFNINGQGADPGSTEMCGAEVCEVLLYNRKLSDTERQQGETYLNNKWRGNSTWPKYYELYYSNTQWTTSADWMTRGTYLDSRNTSGVQSYTHMKSAADQAEPILYYALIEHNISTDVTSAPAIGSAPRTRGSSTWAPITVAPNSQKTQMLYQIPSGQTLEGRVLMTGGNYTVDWGDGTAAANYTDGVVATHQYVYSSMPSAGEIAAGRQAMATVSAQSGQTLSGLELIADPPLGFVPNTPATAHQVAKSAAAWKYTYTVDDTYMGKPRDSQTVWLKLSPVATGSYTIFEDSGGDSYGYLYAGTPTGPDYTDFVTSDDDAGPGSGFQFTYTLNAGTTYYIAATFYNNATPSPRTLRVNVTGGATTGTVVPPGVMPVELNIASDSMRSLKLLPGPTGVNFLSKMTATTFDSMFEQVTSLVNVCGELDCLSTSAKDMFYNCSSLVTPLPRLGTSGVTDFSYMFYSCRAAGFTTVSNLNTDAATSFFHMFDYCDKMTSVSLSSVNNVTNFSYMFYRCAVMSQTGLPAALTTGTGTRNGTTFRGMFSSCGWSGKVLTVIPALDTRNGTDFSSMFDSVSGITTIPMLDTSKGTLFNGMFSYCTSLTSIPLLDTSSGTDFGWMFSDTNSLPTIPLINTSNGTNFSDMFYNGYGLTSLPLINTSNGLDFHEMFAYCNKLTSAGMPLLDTSKGTKFSDMFWNCSNVGFTTIPALNTSSGIFFDWMFEGCTALTSAPITSVANGTTFYAMFIGCTAMPSAGLPAALTSGGGTANGTNFQAMFKNCSNAGFTTMPNINTSNGTNFKEMFSGCTNLVNTTVINTAKGYDVSSMFAGCSNLVNGPALDTGQALLFTQMFYQCTKLATAPITSVAKATDLAQMFYQCVAMTNANLPPALFAGNGTSNVTTFYSMLNGCTGLTTIPALNFSNATNVSYLFNNCTGLTSNGSVTIDLPKATDVTSMFFGCANAGFTVPPVITGTGNACTTFVAMFRGCTALTTLPTLNTAKATSMGYMFYGCTALQSNGSVAYNTSLVTIFQYMFYNCTNAGFTAPPQMNISAGVNFNSMFYGITTITSYPLSGGSTNGTDFTYMFYNHKAMTNAVWTGLNISTAKATTVMGMFLNCNHTGFTAINLTTPVCTNFASIFAGAWYMANPVFSTVSNGTNFQSMFSNCSNGLASANLPAALTSGDGGTSKGTDFSNMFNNCFLSTFTTVPALNCAAGTNFATMFAGANKITAVNITGARYSISIATCAPAMPTANINTFYTNLGTAAGAQTVTVTGLTNQAASNKAIATGKGWTVA